MLKIQAAGHVVVNFPGLPCFAAEANMLSVMGPLPLSRLGFDLDGEVCRWLVGPDDFNAEDALTVRASCVCPKRLEDIHRAILRLEQRTRPDASLFLRVCCRHWDDCYGASSRHQAKTSLTASDSPRSTAR